MELRSNKPKNKIIDYTILSFSVSHIEDEWFFSELCCEAMDNKFIDQQEQEETLDYGDFLSECMDTLSISPTARLMLKEVCEQDWKITLDDLRGGEYCIDVEQKTLILDNNAMVPSALGGSVYFRNIVMVTMIKALRDIWQEKRHGGFDEQYSPDHIILMERVRASDLDVISVLVAWELRSEEEADLWRHMIGSDFGDMAMAFSGHMERDPSSQFNGQALLATFKQWFRSESRINSSDHDTLEYMDEILSLSENGNPFGKRKPIKMSVEMLSCLPDKTAYLQGRGSEILSDPVYSSVNDEINQTHLFHIMHDLEAVIISNVPFRDADLARKIFPIDG